VYEFKVREMVGEVLTLRNDGGGPVLTFSEVEAVTVIEKFCDAELMAFVAVIVYVVTAATVVGVPDISPVLVLKESPGVFEIAGDIE
jgi:hypothetical protein